CGDEPQSVSAYAVLDDVTFVGRWDRVKAAFGSFVEGCEQLGLRVANDKTVLLIQDRAADEADRTEREAKELGVTVADGIWTKLLGAAVGRDEVNMSEFVQKAVGKHD